jgi:hypothetical protein
MGFSSINDQFSEITVAGKSITLPFQRTIVTGATSVAGRFHECFTGVGSGGAHVWTGAAGSAQTVTRTNLGALPFNLDVEADTRHLLSMTLNCSAATAVPAYAMMVDVLGYHPACIVSTGAGSTISAISLPARSSSNSDVQVAAIVQTAIGAATPTTTVTYTNSAGTAGRTGTITFSANSLPVGVVCGGGIAGQLGGPMMALQAGDTGVQSIQSYTTASGTTGTVALVYFRQIAVIPLVAVNTAGEREFTFQMPGMPRLYDGSCLTFFVQVGGALVANQQIHGSYTMAWG